MRRLIGYTLGIAMSGLGLANAMAGEASTSATASNGWYTSGSAGATANYDGNGGIGFARTRSDTGKVNTSRGLAVGVDDDGLDFSFSHAIAPKSGPAYAGTLNLSIGRDGDVNGSYGGSVAQGGVAREVHAGGSTRSDHRGGSAVATAGGETVGGGRVDARTDSFSRDNDSRLHSRPVYVPRSGHADRRYIARSPRAYR
jgi:hypothetical protein